MSIAVCLWGEQAPAEVLRSLALQWNGWLGTN